MSMLEVEGLRVSYGPLVAVREVSFRVAERELVAIIGPNGAGKTTTLRALLGLLPSAGAVRFAGRAIERDPPHRRVRAGLALVPEGRHLFPAMTVEENLALGTRATEAPRGELERVYALFPRLMERRRQLAGTLSGGEQQMLAIGRALASRPKLLMLDEPSLGLAPVVLDALYRTMAELKRDGLAMLLVEQYVYGALEIADRAYVLETGRIAREGRGADLLRDDEIHRTYLTV